MKGWRRGGSGWGGILGRVLGRILGTRPVPIQGWTLPALGLLALGGGWAGVALALGEGRDPGDPLAHDRRAEAALLPDDPFPPQLTRTVDDQGLLHLRWIRPAPLVVGQPVILRWTVLNPSSDPVDFARDPCQEVTDEVTRSGTLELGGVSVRCGEGARSLAPGDSAWVELRGTLLSPPGEGSAGAPFYPGALELQRGDGTGEPLPSARLAAPERVPVVVEVALPPGHGVTAGRIEALAGEVAATRGWIVLPMEIEAARAQVGAAPWVHLGVGEAEVEGALELRGCWTHPMHGDAPCSPMRVRLPPRPAGEMLATEAPVHRFLRTLLALRDPTP